MIDNKAKIEALDDIQRRLKALGAKALTGTLTRPARQESFLLKALEGNYNRLALCAANESMAIDRLALPRLFNAIALYAAAQ